MPGLPWSEDELKLLRDTSLSLKEVVARTGRPRQGVEHKAARIGVRRYEPSSIDWSDSDQVRQLKRERYNATDRTHWSEEELAVLHDLTLTFPQIAARTGRSYDSVKIQARKLGLHCRTYWAQPGYVPGSNDYRGRGWKRIRAEILERDGYTCRDGGEFIPSGQGLVVHHEIPWRLRPVNDSRFLVTLCRVHHGRRSEHSWTEIPEAVLDLI